MSKKSARIHNVSTSPRAAIVDLLRLCDEGAFANDIVPARLSRSTFSDSDRALITKVVYSTLRYQIRIDYALAKLSKRTLETLDHIVLCALRSIVAQLMDEFDMYAVVNETVKVVPFSMKGFINAISRKAIQKNEHDQLFHDEPEYVSACMPEWIFDEIAAVFPDRTDEVIRALNASARVTLAPMSATLDITDALVGEIVPESRLISSAGSISKLDVIRTGAAIVVDQGSQVVAAVVDPKGKKVLDVCCAPGGKSFLLSREADSVVACDVSLSRLYKMIDTKARVHSDNVEIIVSDARALPVDEKSFDRVLVDAPCSGLGVLRRRPDARHRIARDTIRDLCDLQREIVMSAARAVMPGGKLIYSVCTFTQEETLEMDQWLSKHLDGFVVDDIEFTTPLVTRLGSGYLLAPTPDSDAMYILRLTKT